MIRDRISRFTPHILAIFVDGFETLPGYKMEIYGPGWKWEGTWMEERQYALALDSGGPGPGWRWDVHFWNWVGLIWCLYGFGMQLLWPGWRWDVTWMEVIGNYRDLGWGETRSGWKLVVNLGAWMELRGRGWQWDTNTSIPGWGYNQSLVEMRCNYRD